MEPQLTNFKASFVSISTEHGIPVGAGFLVSYNGHFLTCAHVVAAAVRDEATEAQAEIPQGTVHLNFHFLEGQPGRTARTVYWQPRAGSETNPSGDIAVLRLTEDLPDEALPIRLTASNDLFGHAFRAHGFPRDTDSGVWAYGVVRDPLGNGWLQVEDTKEQGRRIEQGFSGGPIQDLRTGRFVGMVAASSEYVKAAKVGYVIPAEILARAWHNLPVDSVEHAADQSVGAIHLVDEWIEMPHWTDVAEVRFSVTNLSNNVVALAKLLLRVQDRRTIDKVRLRKAGAPFVEYNLYADVSERDEVDLLKETNAQFLLEPSKTDAFRLSFAAPEGYLYTCQIHARLDDLAGGGQRWLKSTPFQVEHPIRSVDVLRARKKD